MKNLILLVVCFFSVSVMAQIKVVRITSDQNLLTTENIQKPYSNHTETASINWYNLPSVQFPTTDSDNPWKTINDPYELSWYCSKNASAKLDKFYGHILNDVWLTVGGCALVGGSWALLNFRDPSELNESVDITMLCAGGVLILAGTINGIIGVFDLIGHFQWNYRKKQVDFYFSPASAVLKF